MTNLNFKVWLENLWGNIPSKSRKPSDGWGQGGSMAAPMMSRMKKKMKKK